MEEHKYKPGDWVEVTNAFMPNGYSEGDVLKIKLIEDGGHDIHYTMYPLGDSSHKALVFEREIEKTFKSMVEGAARDEEERLNKTKHKKEEQT